MSKIVTDPWAGCEISSRPAQRFRSWSEPGNYTGGEHGISCEETLLPRRDVHSVIIVKADSISTNMLLFIIMSCYWPSVHII